MRSRKIEAHIGNVAGMGKRFASAWKKASRGDTVARDHVTFLDLESFMATMSPKRLALMRYLRAHGPMSVRKLSGALERDYKAVHRDVSILESAGLIQRKAQDAIAVSWDRLRTELDLAA